MAHKADTRPLHLFLSAAIFSTSFQVFPIFFRSPSIVLLHVSLGLPEASYVGINSAFLAFEQGGILIVPHLQEQGTSLPLLRLFRRKTASCEKHGVP